MSRKCPITYQDCGDETYSNEGLKRVSPQLSRLDDLPFDRQTILEEAALRAQKMSIQGVQPKLGARLSVKNSRFDVVDTMGRFILKPQSMWPQIPENQDLTMRLAEISGMEVPLHGMMYAMDQSLVYFIARFDRYGRSSRKRPVEDFAQLLGESRHTKYKGSMELVIQVIERYCTFPVLEKSKLFARTIFNFLVGNEDMHLKNFSLITDHDVVRLAPVYDFLNSTIVLKDPEEMALPLNGKKKNLTRRMLVQYFGSERLALESKVIDDHLQRFAKDIPVWFSWIERSFLSAQLQAKYRQIVEKRAEVLDLV